MKQHLSFTTFLNISGCTTLLATLLLSISSLVAKEAPLLSQQMVEPYGLTRTWFNQIEIDPNRTKVMHAIVEGDTMFIVSSDAKLHAIDADTGKTLWMRTLGRRETQFQEPAVNSRMVAVLGGMEMFVINRKNGKLLQQIGLPGACAAACEMSENYIYVPMMDKRIVAYPLVEVAGPKMEEEGGTGSEDAVPGGALEDAEENTAPGGGSTEHEDSVLANIVREFAKARDSIMAEAAPPAKEREIVLKPVIGIPMTTISFGTVLVKPLVSTQIVTYNQRGRINSHREIVTWVTEEGFFLAAGINSLSQDQFDLQYSIDSSSQTYYLGTDRIARREWDANRELGARPTPNQSVPIFSSDNKTDPEGIASMVVTGGKAGYVFAVKDRLGEVVWQFAANGPIRERIAIIGKDVYCCTSTGGMHALNLLDGKEKWYSQDIQQFIAASKKRIYTLDRRDRMVILDRNTGARLNSFDARRFDRFLFNLQTDRIYIINDSGLIQCLNERQPQTLENLLANTTKPVVRHRVTCKEYADVMMGKPAPVLYWMDGGEGDDEEEGVEAVPRHRNSGDDGSLDGNDMDIDVQPKKKAAPKKSEEKSDADNDPFS